MSNTPERPDNEKPEPSQPKQSESGVGAPPPETNTTTEESVASPAPDRSTASARHPQLTNKESDDEVSSLRSKNVADRVSGGSVSQAGRDIHQHGFSSTEVFNIFDRLLTRLGFYQEDDPERRQKTRKTTVSRVQVEVQQPPPQNEHEYAEQFDKLSNEDKLFVTLLRLFPDITWVNFWEIYDAAADSVLPKPTTTRKKNNNDEEEHNPPRPTPPRFRSETYWAKVAHAAITQTTEVYDEGKSTQTTVNFVSEDVDVRKIIERSLSTYQPQWLFRLVPVLYTLGQHPHVVIRRMAARAAAALADIDWDYVRRMIIEPWSRDSNAATRAAVAYLLDAVVESGTNDGHAIALLDRWSNPMGQFYPRQSWTAAATFRLVGFRRFETAKQDLRMLARLADEMLETYFEDYKNLPENYLDYVSNTDRQLMEEVPAAVVFTLVHLAVEGKAPEIITMLKEWLDECEKHGCYLYWNAVIFGALQGIAAETFKLKRDKAELKVDFFALLENDKEFRKCLGDILAHLVREGPEYRRVITTVLQEWTCQLADLELTTEPVGRVIVNIYRRLDTTNRERLLRMLGRWSQHKHSAVKARGAETVRLLLAANYPLPNAERKGEGQAPPEHRPSNESSSDTRIVFGKPQSQSNS